METKNLAIRRAKENLREFGIPDNLSELHKSGVSIQRRILGGSHSVVTYPPLDSLQPISGEGLYKNLRYGSSAHLYIHIAFCETRCTFCHYSVDLYRGIKDGQAAKIAMVDRYLRAIKSELRWYAVKFQEWGTKISSVFIGGGTPLVLSKEQLVELVSAIKTDFHILPGAEFCVEGSPLTITEKGGEEKLLILRDLGLTRLSFGVQSFDNAVLKAAARGYKREVALRACKIASRVIDNWNIDLIQGLYDGSLDEVWNNLKAIEKILPPHLTWYHGRFANRPQGDWLTDKKRQSHFETEMETLTGRTLIWQQMAKLGYTQVDANRFAYKETFSDPFKTVRTSVSNDLLGIGASSYSHVDMRNISSLDSEGWFFRNESDIQAYMKNIELTGASVVRALPFNSEEWLAGSYVIGLRKGLRTDSITKVRKYDIHYGNLVNKLKKLGLLEETDATLRLSRLGQLFEDEILSLFYSPSVKKYLK